MERTRESRKLGLAILISLFLHLVVGFSLAAFGSAYTPALPLEDKPVELTIVDSSSESAPLVPKDPAYLETDPSKESAEKPKEQTFESNANSIGASQLPATGDVPLPTQEGKEKKERSSIDLETHQHSLATDGSRPQPETQPVTRPESKPAQVAPTARPVATKAPVSQPVATPEVERLAMLSSTPPPPINVPEETEPSPPPITAESVPQTAPRPKPELAASNYRALKEQTRITGGLTNRGPSAVNAVGTPLGRYKKAVSDAIGSRWYFYVKAKSDLISIGNTTIHAEIDAKGHLQNMRVVSNTANEAFANVCLQSFQEAQIPPIPPDLVDAFPDGRMSIDFNFVLFPN